MSLLRDAWGVDAFPDFYTFGSTPPTRRTGADPVPYSTVGRGEAPVRRSPPRPPIQHVSQSPCCSPLSLFSLRPFLLMVDIGLVLLAVALYLLLFQWILRILRNPDGSIDWPLLFAAILPPLVYFMASPLFRFCLHAGPADVGGSSTASSFIP